MSYWLRKFSSTTGSHSKTGKPYFRPRIRLETLEDRLTPAVHEWTGQGANNLWSNTANWTNGSPGTDVTGDIDLVFHTNLANAANLTTQNDIAGLVVDSITFDANAGMGATGGTSNSGYTINGNTITINTGSPGQDPFGIDVANNVTTGTGLTETFNTGLTLATTDATFRSQQSLARLTLTGAIDLGGRTLTIDNTTGAGNNASIQGVTISGAISNGSLTKTGSGTLELSGNNTYADTTVNSGFVLVDTSTSLGATAGTITANNPGQIQLRNGITVVKTTFNNNSNSLGGGLGADGNTTNTFRGNLVLMAGNGGVALGAGNGAANTSTRLVVDGAISGATSTLSINGSGVVEFTQNNTYTGQTNLNGNQGPGTLQIDTQSGLGTGGAGNETIVQSGNTLLLNFNGTLQDTGSVAEPIQFAGRGVGGLGAVRIPGSNNVLIPGTVTFIAGAPWVFGVDGATGLLTLTGVIDSQGANRALTEVGTGTLVIGGTGGNAFIGTIVNGGLLSVTNTSATPLGSVTGGVTVNATGTLRVGAGVVVPNGVNLNVSGTLEGTGTIGLLTTTGGTVSPGTGGVGTLTVTSTGASSLANATFRVDLTNAPSADRLQFNANPLNLVGATLSVSATSTSTTGQVFTILVSNGGFGGTTFAGLPNNTMFAAANGRIYQIAYTGTTVTLTDKGTATAPTITSTNAATFTLGAAGTFTITTTGSPTPMIAQSGSLPGGVTFTDNGNGTATLTGKPAVSGTFTLTLTASNGFSTAQTFTLTVPPPPPSTVVRIAVGTGVGIPALVNVDDANGTLQFSFQPFGGYSGGVTVATGDVNGDGTADIIVGAGPGASGGHVEVFDGRTGLQIQSFFAFQGFAGGVFVGAGDVNGDGAADIIVGAGAGAPGGHVKVFDGKTGAPAQSFLAASPGVNGVRVAGADVNGDGVADIVTGVGPGGRSRVAVFDGTTLAPRGNFLAFDPSFIGGVFVG